jgi:hypothetical protein
MRTHIVVWGHRRKMFSSCIYIYTYIHIYITSSFDRLRWNLWDKKKRERKVIPAKRQKRNEDSLLLTQPIYYLIYYWVHLRGSHMDRLRPHIPAKRKTKKAPTALHRRPRMRWRMRYACVDVCGAHATSHGLRRPREVRMRWRMRCACVDVCLRLWRMRGVCVDVSGRMRYACSGRMRYACGDVCRRPCPTDTYHDSLHPGIKKKGGGGARFILLFTERVLRYWSAF